MFHIKGLEIGSPIGSGAGFALSSGLRGSASAPCVAFAGGWRG